MVHIASILPFICAMIVLTYQRGTFFEEMMEQNQKDDGLARLPMKEFHQCSIKDDCNFIIQDKKTKKFSKVNRQRDLPGNRALYKMWRKNTEEETEEPQIPGPTPNAVLSSSIKPSNSSKPSSNQSLTTATTHQAFNTCEAAWEKGVRSDGPVNLKWDNGSSFQAFCNMTIAEGGWTVIQRRINDGVSFERNWTDYERGFGNIYGSFWLGLAAIRKLTEANRKELRIDLVNSNGSTGYATYKEFYLGGKDEDYALHLKSFEDGNIGDALAIHNNLPFSTRDKDHDDNKQENCALNSKGAWWHKHCFDANLNSIHPDVAKGHPKRKTMSWRPWRPQGEKNFGGIIYSEMKIK